ncbi:DNA repair protein UVH3-like [Durio zibethinus]|uniref:DNA repair protein UVH3-like n=1 Tax=Durio zibethinus TaxID=66656 RepID=A0A6P6BBF2_DURZI|nr:DNA repair protein UVH3-like [Durio zibethinus]
MKLLIPYILTCSLKTQLRLEAFYTFNERFVQTHTKRIKKVVKGITRNQSSELIDDAMQQVPKSRKKRRVGPVPGGENKSGEPSNKNADIGSHCRRKSLEKSVPKPPRKSQNPGKYAIPVMSTPEPSLQAACGQKAIKQSPGNGRGRGKQILILSILKPALLLEMVAKIVRKLMGRR